MEKMHLAMLKPGPKIEDDAGFWTATTEENKR